jgi:hypothetical protein
MVDNQYGTMMKKGLLKEKLVLERNIKLKKGKKKDRKNTYYEYTGSKIGVEVRYVLIMYVYMSIYV